MGKDFAQHKLSLTKDIPYPNPYIDLMLGEYSPWTVVEEKAPDFRGAWREKVFAVEPTAALDLEIGTGNGFHFGHHCLRHPDRSVVGLEIKYKPLIQSIRRVVQAGGVNGRMVRFHAGALHEIFGPGELDNIYIHFPDPWPKKRQVKNRLLSQSFLDMVFGLQGGGGFIEFKTDSQVYFEWAVENMEKSAYEVEYLTRDLHSSSRKDENFRTQFENIFLSKGQPIFYAQLRKA